MATSSIIPVDTTGRRRPTKSTRSPTRFSRKPNSLPRTRMPPGGSGLYSGRPISTGSHNPIDLKIVLAVGIASFTIMEGGASAATPVWVTLAMFGLNHLIEANTPKDKEDEEDDDSALVTA